MFFGTEWTSYWPSDIISFLVSEAWTWANIIKVSEEIIRVSGYKQTIYNFPSFRLKMRTKSDVWLVFHQSHLQESICVYTQSYLIISFWEHKKIMFSADQDRVGSTSCVVAYIFYLINSLIRMMNLSPQISHYSTRL